LLNKVVQEDDRSAEELGVDEKFTFQLTNPGKDSAINLQPIRKIKPTT